MIQIIDSRKIIDLIVYKPIFVELKSLHFVLIYFKKYFVIFRIEISSFIHETDCVFIINGLITKFMKYILLIKQL
jgi:hypothetical protein